jgi:hypothetical protein
MTKPTALTQTFAHSIDGIVDKRINWEAGTRSASDNELYSILGDCLDLFLELKSGSNAAKAVNQLLKQKSITYTNATSLELKLVRLVFTSANTAKHMENRMLSYARVIRVAANAKQTGQTLPQFIKDRHGIEEIRRANKDGLTAAGKAKALADLASEKLSASSDSDLLNEFDLPDQLQPNHGQQFSLALVRKNANGTGTIVFGTANVSAVTAVLALAGSMLQQAAINAIKEESTKKVAAIQERNMAELETVLSEKLIPNQPVTTPSFAASDEALELA